MLNEVLNYLNNYFEQPNLYQYSAIVYQFTVDTTFTATDTLGGAFEDTVIAGEYIRLQGTKLNDGVYLITANDATSLTIDATLDIAVATEAEISTTIKKSYIPAALLTIIAAIKVYNASTGAQGVKSESQGKRSITYAGNDNSWIGVYRSKLAPYKRLGW